MVLDDVVVEQQVEPVGVAELCLLQVGVHGSIGVRQAELPLRLIILGDEVVHAAVETRAAAVGQRRELQPALGGHFLVDTHLLLRVTDVVLGIAGLQAVGELTRIVDCAMTHTAFLRCDDNHTRHGARTVNRRGRTVLQHLERLDVVGVQTGNGIRNQCLGVTRREVVSIHVHGTLQNHTIDHPQRARRTINRRGTTHANFRSRTERSRHVLHTHASYSAFQRAAHVGHTRKLGLVGIHLGRGTREHSLIHLLHTCHHDFVNRFRVGDHLDGHVLSTFGCYCHIANRAHFNRWGLLACCKREVTVNVGHSEGRFLPLQLNHRTNNRFVIVLGNNRTRDLGLCHGHP